MERRLKERLIGAAVLVMLAVIFIPMILDDSMETDTALTETNIPPRPDDNFNSRIVPLEEPDLTPVPDEAPEKDLTEAVPLEEEQALVENVPGPAPVEPAVEDAPRKAGADKPVGATAWVVQLGSFNSEDNARTLNEKLRKAGYPAFVEPLKRDSGISYRVRVGPELLRSEAQALKEEVSNKLEIEGIVIRYP